MNRTFTFVISIFACLSSFAQIFESDYFQNNPGLGGDVVIKSASIQVNEEKEEIFKIFEIESFGEGSYYMDSWIMAPLVNESYPEYKVEVNGILSALTFKPQTDGWHSLALTDNKSAATVHLKKGINTISVIGKGAAVPAVEFIKLSSGLSKTGISDTNYRKFVDDIKSGTLDETYNSNLRKGASVRSLNGEIYDFYRYFPKNYTEWKSFHCYSGSTVTISAESSMPCMIYLFNKDNPGSYSWCGSSTGITSLTVTIPKTGTYIALARSLNHLVRGGTDITANINGTSYTYNNCMVTYATVIPVTPGYPIPANFFTCESDYDTWLFLTDSSGYIRAYNKDGGTTSDGYSWGTNPRIETSLPGIKYALVFNETSYSPHNTVCDVYLGLGRPQSTKGYYQGAPSYNVDYPNLHLSNSFRSGDQYGNYNCIAWSMGIDYAPVLIDSLMHGRYVNAGYTRDGANEANGDIAIWGYIVGNDTIVRHASVRKNALDINPHGFDWESRMGTGRERIMHTRNALAPASDDTLYNENKYGTILYYYRANPYRTYNQSINSNARASFTPSDLNRISTLKSNIPSAVVSDFDTQYLAWEETWDWPEYTVSDPLQFPKTSEYSSLLEYCQKYGKAIWPLLFDRVAQDDVFVINLLRDLTYKGDSNFSEAITKPLIGTGIPWLTSIDIQINYCQELLAKEESNIINSIKAISETQEGSPEVKVNANSQEIRISLNPANDGKASVAIYNVFGGLEYNANHNLSKGSQTVIINASNLKKGIYVVHITMGGETISQTISI